MLLFACPIIFLSVVLVIIFTYMKGASYIYKWGVKLQAHPGGRYDTDKERQVNIITLNPPPIQINHVWFFSIF